MPRKELSWRKDAIGQWLFHWGLTSRREIVQSWFNWRPGQFCLGLNIALAPSGFNLELAFWFHWNFTILFFDPSKTRKLYDDEDSDW